MIKITFDNGEVYTEEQYKKDYVRMMDSLREDNFGAKNCRSVDCEDCPLYKETCLRKSDEGNSDYRCLETVKIVHDWAKAHQIVTNIDKLAEMFGFDGICYNFSKNQLKIVYQGISRIFTCDDDDICDISEWFEKEYKEPKKGKNNVD